MDADHVTAWSKGGATDISNCQMLCQTHNRAKGNKQQTFGTIFGTRKLFSEKHTQAEGVGNQHLPLVLSVFLQQNSPIFGAKPLPRRRFLQHYYRGTPKNGKVKTANRKATKSLEMCQRSPMVVPKLAGNFQHNIQHSQTFFLKTQPLRIAYNIATSTCYIRLLNQKKSPIFGTKAPKR